jgi:hypothetical protein
MPLWLGRREALPHAWLSRLCLRWVQFQGQALKHAEGCVMEREISYFDETYKREIRGTYIAEKGMITVRSAYGSKSTQVGGSAMYPEPLAGFYCAN